ncbi:MAG: DUF4835 family protein [Flavobacteriales bacterium]|nr:DUF4835 family protein [Flavobacteriales bacterium]
MKKLFLTLSMILLAFGWNAQELNCNVSIIRPQVMISGPEIFETMENSIQEFLNGRRWTNDNWNTDERIDCTIQITIEQQVSQRDFKGTIQVGSSRPVYNSDQNSPVLSINDRDFQFSYQENTLIQWSNDQHRDNLSSTLAFYAYLILAMDYDTFSLEGGTDYYLLCQTIVNNAQNAPEAGWRGNEKSQQNRYWIIENILSQTFKPLRTCLYQYHRHGFDKLYGSDVPAARNTIAEAILELKNIHKVRPSSYNMQIFFYAKADELVSLFKPVEVVEKQRVYDCLKQIDPGNINKYEGMMN